MHSPLLGVRQLLRVYRWIGIFPARTSKDAARCVGELLLLLLLLLTINLLLLLVVVVGTNLESQGVRSFEHFLPICHPLMLFLLLLLLLLLLMLLLLLLLLLLR